MDEEQLKEIVIEAWEKWELEPELFFCQRTTAFAKWFIENNPNYSADITTDEIDDWILRTDVHWDTFSREIEKLNNEIILLINPHLNTLLKKRRRMLLKDDYGFINENKWQEELDYFLNRVIIPNTIEARENVTSAHRKIIEVDGVNDVKGGVDCALATIDGMKRLINQILDDLKEKVSNQEIDVSLLDPNEYEYFCADLLEKIGWDARVTQASGDQGIDVLAEKDGFIWALQCKKYSSPVGNKAVQEAYSGGAFYEANASAVVSPVEYTASAKELANSLGVRLLHHEDLSNLTVIDKEQE